LADFTAQVVFRPVDGRGQNDPAMTTDIHLIQKGVAQLFVDDVLIGHETGLRRTLHQPVKDNDGEFPIIELGDEFGGLRSTLESNGTILYDPRLGRYVMFALGYAFSSNAWDRVRRYRFTSGDGINWIHGDDGRPQVVFPRSEADLYNPKAGRNAAGTDMFSCCFDSSDPIYPYKGWQWFPKWTDHGAMVYTQSRDGVNWELGDEVAPYNLHPIEHEGHVMEGPGDGTSIYLDPVEHRYLASIRYWCRDEVGPGNRLRSRAYLFLDRIDERPDFGRIEGLDLVPSAEEKNGDRPSDEYYMTSTWRYESLWLGGLRIWHRDGNYPYSPAGSAFLKLVVSRDGLHWNKVPYLNDDGVSEVFIPNGPEGGNGGRNDGGYITEFTQGPLQIGDELIYYYGATSYGKNNPDENRVTGGGIFRARMRKDGFVSVDNGCLTTRLLRSEGDELMTNSIGALSVEVLDATGKSRGKISIDGDDVRTRIRISGKNLRQLVGSDKSTGSTNPFKLRFRLGSDGRLFSFAVA
jgi:hypothetical protein